MSPVLPVILSVRIGSKEVRFTGKSITREEAVQVLLLIAGVIDRQGIDGGMDELQRLMGSRTLEPVT